MLLSLILVTAFAITTLVTAVVACPSIGNINAVGRYPGNSELTFPNSSHIVFGYTFITPNSALTTVQDYTFYNLSVNCSIGCANDYGFVQWFNLATPLTFSDIANNVSTTYHGVMQAFEIPNECDGKYLRFIPEPITLTGFVASSIAGTIITIDLTVALYSASQRWFGAGNVTEINPGTYSISCV